MFFPVANWMKSDGRSERKTSSCIWKMCCASTLDEMSKNNSGMGPAADIWASLPPSAGVGHDEDAALLFVLVAIAGETADSGDVDDDASVAERRKPREKGRSETDEADVGVAGSCCCRISLQATASASTRAAST